MPAPESPRDLLRRATQGDEEALVSLLQSRAPPLRRRLEPRIPKGRRSVLSVDDLLQQTFVDACRDIKSFDPDRADSFQAWLETIAERNLIDALRMLDTAKRGGDRLPDVSRTREESCRDLVDLLGASESTPSRKVAVRESHARLERAIASLPHPYKLVIERYDLQEQSIGDVARELGRSEGAVYMLRARAHRLLAQVLGDPSSSADSRE